jgi:hypothetical protein
MNELENELKQMGLVIVRQNNKKVIAKLKDVRQVLKINELTKQIQTLLQNDQTVVLIIAKSGDYILQKVITKNSTNYEIKNNKDELVVNDINALEKVIAVIKKIENIK